MSGPRSLGPLLPSPRPRSPHRQPLLARTQLSSLGPLLTCCSSSVRREALSSSLPSRQGPLLPAHSQGPPSSAYLSTHLVQPAGVAPGRGWLTDPGRLLGCPQGSQNTYCLHHNRRTRTTVIRCHTPSRVRNTPFEFSWYLCEVDCRLFVVNVEGWALNPEPPFHLQGWCPSLLCAHLLSGVPTSTGALGPQPSPSLLLWKCPSVIPNDDDS